jgi:hypothetical protein
MHIHGYTLRNRRGLGSILGGAFLVLIMLIGYTVYTFSIQAINDQQQVLSDMRAYDIDRSQEALKSDSEPIWNESYLIASVQNIGPKPVKIVNIGVWDGNTRRWSYELSKLEVWNEAEEKWEPFLNPPNEPPAQMIAPSEYKAFRATVDIIEEPKQDYTYKLQFLTDKGTIFEVGYPYSAHALDHFEFEEIDNQVLAQALAGFDIAITAKDVNGKTVTSYTGMTNTLSDSSGTINPVTTGLFNFGIWKGTVTITTVFDDNKITTTGYGKVSDSNIFDVVP